jgi:hypothetical protein
MSASMASTTWAMTGGLWPHHVGAQDLLGVLVDHQLQRPLWDRQGSPARALNAKIGRGGRHAPAGGRGLLGGQAHGGKRRPGVYRPRQALAADLSGFPERVAAGHGLRRHRPVGQPGWAGHVAVGVDAGRGGALLVDGDAAVVPKPDAGVVRPSSSTLGRRRRRRSPLRRRRAEPSITRTVTNLGLSKRHRWQFVVHFWPLRQGRVARSSARHAKPAERARATTLALSALSEDLTFLAGRLDVKQQKRDGRP